MQTVRVRPVSVAVLLLAVATAAAVVSAQIPPDHVLNHIVSTSVDRTAAEGPVTRPRELAEGVASEEGGIAGGAERGEKGESGEGRSRKQHWIYTHAVIMCVAWVGLLPLGILLSQSRWARPVKTQAGGKALWFWLHMVINISAVALVIAAYAIATSDSTHMNIEKDDGSLAQAHKAVGTVAFALLLLQVVAAFIRPHPGKRFRSAWNFVHHNMGRLVVLVAWAAIWLGVVLWHGEEGPRGGYPRWIAPLAAAQGVILIAFLVNQGMKKRAMRDQKTQRDYQAKHAEREGRDAAVVGAPAGSDPDGSTATNGSIANGGQPYATSVRPTGLQTV